MARNKPRKWSNLKGQIPDAPVELSERFQEVLAETDKLRIKETGEVFSMADLQNEWVALEEEADFASLQEHQRNVKFDALERRILEELEKVKAVAGTDMWRGEHKTFSPKFTPRPTVTDLQALMQWIKDTKQEDQLTLAHPRLKAIVCEALDPDAAAAMTPAERAALKPGAPASGLPPPGVKVFLDTGVNHTSVKRARVGDPEDDAF